MDVRRSLPALDVRGIAVRLDGLEAVAALPIGDLHAEAFEIRVDRRRIGVAWMHVAPVRVGLPDLDARARHRLALRVEHAPHEMDDLPVRAAWLTRHPRQV